LTIDAVRGQLVGKLQSVQNATLRRVVAELDLGTRRLALLQKVLQDGRIPLRSVWTNSALRAEVTPFSSVSSKSTRRVSRPSALERLALVPRRQQGVVAEIDRNHGGGVQRSEVQHDDGSSM
jgi:hypothetical protein